MPEPTSDQTLANIPAQQQQWPGHTAEMTPTPDHGEQSWTGRDRLTGKRALITGGDSGIGRATAIAFAKEGADVAIAFLPEEAEDAEQVRAEVEKAGRRCVLIPADIRTEEAARDVAERARSGLGGIDVLVCNAAFQMAQPDLEEFPPGQLERTFETNVFATFWLTQAVAPTMAAGSSVLITTSIQAFSPSEPLLDYAATKAALNNLMVNLAAMLGPKGIRVNAVAPGPIWTPLIPATFGEDKVEGFGADTPLGRAGQPIEVASAFVYLASDEASYVSGTVLGVTGGKPVF
ncbi:SDR family oxidoreductase [Knoellia sp. 3-2P3]|uniref:SDR family oxidoreductase n=1 Tax=unclassified Knoellia TaxID=2618719 RepID=UPI0023DCACED|nr:SDR family oxidoreductase [Knoellia sp. 3-2P3]MDF2091498.1 SDR family oxidoreductase [Knoellia sp. 3-2P3]